MNVNPFRVSRLCRVVGLDGLEPSTSRLSGVRSNHLSYKPIIHSFGIGSRHHSSSEVLSCSISVQTSPSGFEVPVLRCTSPILGVGTADWWRWWGSNPWPPACRAGALPAELHPHIHRLSFLSKIISDLRKLNNKSFCTVLPISSFRLRQIRENLSWSP